MSHCHLPHRRFRARGFGALLAVTLAVAACGGGGASAGESPDPSHTGAERDTASRVTTTSTTAPSITTTTDRDPTTTSPSVATTEADPTTTAPPVTQPRLPATTSTMVDRGSDPPPPVTDPAGPPGRNSVLVVGDSVLMGAASTIPRALPDWLVTFDAVGSRRLAQAVDLFAERRDEIGGAVVILLGNNFIPGERGDYASQLDEVMSLLWFVPRVVWVTVAEVHEGRAEINAAIREAASRWPNMRVADWAPIVAADPSLSWDGLHLTVAGREALATVIAETLGPVDP